MKKIRRLETQNKKIREVNNLNFDDKRSEIKEVENNFIDDGDVDYGFKRGKTFRDNVSGKQIKSLLKNFVNQSYG